MLTNDNWTRRTGNITGTTTYWGYSNPGVLSGNTGWAIKRWITVGSDDVIEWANDSGTFENIWSERLACFAAPTSNPIITETGSTNSSIWLKWNRIPGVSQYLVKMIDNSTGIFVGKWNNWTLTNEYAAKMDLLPSNTSYTVSVTAKNRVGTSGTTTQISTTS